MSDRGRAQDQTLDPAELDLIAHNPREVRGRTMESSPVHNEMLLRYVAGNRNARADTLRYLAGLPDIELAVIAASNPNASTGFYNDMATLLEAWFAANPPPWLRRQKGTVRQLVALAVAFVENKNASKAQVRRVRDAIYSVMPIENAYREELAVKIADRRAGL